MLFVKTQHFPTLLPFPPPSPTASPSSTSLNDRPLFTLSTPLTFPASWTFKTGPFNHGSEYDFYVLLRRGQSEMCVYLLRIYLYYGSDNEVKILRSQLSLGKQ